MESRVEEEFCQAVNRLALQHAPKSIGRYLEYAVEASVFTMGSEIIALIRDDIYRINVKTGCWSKLSISDRGEDLLSFVEDFTDFSTMESATFLIWAFCFVDDENQEDLEQDLDRAEKPRVTFG